MPAWPTPWPPPRRVYLVLARLNDPGALPAVTGRVQRALARTGEGNPQVESFLDPAGLPVYQRMALASSALLWTDRPAPPVEVADLFDSIDETGGPGFAGSRPALTDLERTELVTAPAASSAAASAPLAAKVEDLHGLPFVFGPVFASHQAWAALRQGEEFVESNRLEVVLRPANGPVIWSTSARCLNGSATAVFAPGSRFRVLNAEPGCLMLLEMAGGGREIDDDRLVQRMLSALALTSGRG